MTSKSWRSDQIWRAMVASMYSCSAWMPAALVGLAGGPQLVDRLVQRGQLGELLLGPRVGDLRRLELVPEPLVDAHALDLGDQPRGRAERDPAGQVPDRVGAQGRDRDRRRRRAEVLRLLRRGGGGRVRRLRGLGRQVVHRAALGRVARGPGRRRSSPCSCRSAPCTCARSWAAGRPVGPSRCRAGCPSTGACGCLGIAAEELAGQGEPLRRHRGGRAPDHAAQREQGPPAVDPDPLAVLLVVVVDVIGVDDQVAPVVHAVAVDPVRAAAVPLGRPVAGPLLRGRARRPGPVPGHAG